MTGTTSSIWNRLLTLFLLIGVFLGCALLGFRLRSRGKAVWLGEAVAPIPHQKSNPQSLLPYVGRPALELWRSRGLGSLTELLRSGQDPHSVLATQAMVEATFLAALQQDAPSAIAWLVAASRAEGMTPLFFRSLAAKAADVDPVGLLKSAGTAPQLNSLCDLTSAALEKLSPADLPRLSGIEVGTVDVEKIHVALQSLFKAHLDLAHSLSGRAVLIDLWINGLSKNCPRELMALEPALPGGYWSTKLMNEAVFGLGKIDREAAVDIVLKAEPGSILDSTRLKLMIGLKPEQLDTAVQLIQHSGDAAGPLASFLGRLGQTWPDEKKDALFQWAMNQPPEVGHFVMTGLLPALSITPEAQRSLLDSMLLDPAADYSVAECVLKAGDLQPWIEWIQSRGGISEAAAKRAVDKMMSRKDPRITEWAASHEHQNLLKSMMRR
jgi:hypothetical protein